MKEDHYLKRVNIENENDKHNENDIRDVDYKLDEVLQADERMNEAENASISICALDISPISFQVKRKHIDDLSLSRRKSFIAKYKKVKQQLKRRLAEAAAPGQVESSWIKYSVSSEDSDEMDDVGEDLLEFVQLYPENDSILKLIILSLVLIYICSQSQDGHILAMTFRCAIMCTCDFFHLVSL